MALEPLTAAPVLSDFTLLNEYTSQTPGTFFGGLPVLHLHAPSATIKLQSSDAATHPEFTALADPSTSSALTDGPLLIPSIDIWITSRALLLWSTAQSKGLTIPYPVITVTAQDRTEVLLELNLSALDASNEELDFLQLRLIANEVTHHAAATAEAAAGANGTAEQARDASAKKVFRAISDCQELNPDLPVQGEDGEEGEEGGFDPTAPGATGWITSENMADFMDENGEFKMPEGMTVIGGEEEDEESTEEAQQNGLGEGAGRRRTADEANGDAEEGAERTNGEENKWQRTG